jgi:hypothetical protein
MLTGFIPSAGFRSNDTVLAWLLVVLLSLDDFGVPAFLLPPFFLGPPLGLGELLDITADLKVRGTKKIKTCNS